MHRHSEKRQTFFLKGISFAMTFHWGHFSLKIVFPLCPERACWVCDCGLTGSEQSPLLFSLLLDSCLLDCPPAWIFLHIYLNYVCLFLILFLFITQMCVCFHYKVTTCFIAFILLLWKIDHRIRI